MPERINLFSNHFLHIIYTNDSMRNWKQKSLEFEAEIVFELMNIVLPNEIT